MVPRPPSGTLGSMAGVLRNTVSSYLPLPQGIGGYAPRTPVPARALTFASDSKSPGVLPQEDYYSPMAEERASPASSVKRQGLQAPPTAANVGRGKSLGVKLFSYDNHHQLCCAPVGTGGWCIAPKGECGVRAHARAGPLPMQSGWYLKRRGTTANVAPHMPLAVGHRNSSFQSIVNESYEPARWELLLQKMGTDSQSYEPDDPKLAETLGLTDPTTEEEKNSLVRALIVEPDPTPMKKTRILTENDFIPSMGDELHAFSQSQIAKWEKVSEVLGTLTAAGAFNTAMMGTQPPGHDNVWKTLSGVDSFVEEHRGLIEFLASVQKDGRTNFAALHAEVQKIRDLETRLAGTGQAANTALTEAAAAGAEAGRASATVNAFMATGVTTSNGNLFSRLSLVESAGAGTVTLVNRLMAAVVQGPSRTGISTPSPTLNMEALYTKEQVNTMMATRDTDIERLRQLMKGGGIHTSVGNFESLTDVEVFVATHFPSGSVIECFMDINVGLCSLQDATTDIKEIRESEVHSEKTGRNNDQLLVVSSFKSETPPVLAGPKEGRDSAVHYGACKTHADGDMLDGQNGCRHKILARLDRRNHIDESFIDTRLQGHGLAQSLCRELVLNTMTFYQQMSAMMSQLYLLLVTKAFGSEAKASKDSMAACWKIVTTLLRVMFEELFKARVGSENGYLFSGKENSIYLHGVLQGHRVMKEFSSVGFTEHAKFYPKLLMHLFESCAPKSAVVEADTSRVDMAKRIKALEISLKECRSLVDKKINKVANPRGGNPNGGRRQENMDES